MKLQDALLPQPHPVHLACRKLHFIIPTFCVEQENNEKTVCLLILLYHFRFLVYYTSQHIHDTYYTPLKPSHHTDSISEIKMGGYTFIPTPPLAKFGQSQLTPVFLLLGADPVLRKRVGIGRVTT